MKRKGVRSAGGRHVVRTVRWAARVAEGVPEWAGPAAVGGPSARRRRPVRFCRSRDAAPASLSPCRLSRGTLLCLTCPATALGRLCPDGPSGACVLRPPSAVTPRERVASLARPLLLPWHRERLRGRGCVCVPVCVLVRVRLPGDVPALTPTERAARLRQRQAECKRRQSRIGADSE